MPRRIPKAIPSVSIADIWAYTSRNVTEHEFEEFYGADEVQTTLNTIGSDQSLGSRNIVVAIPVNMEIVRVLALALIEVANRTTNAQNIDLNLKVDGTPIFSQDDVAVFDDAIGTCPVVISQDATAIVTGDGTYSLEAEAQISAAQNVTFTVQYYLFVLYRRS